MHFMRHNSVIIDFHSGSHSVSPIDNADQKRCGRNKCQSPICPHRRQSVLTVTIPPTTTKPITGCVDHSSQWNTTGEIHRNSTSTDVTLNVNDSCHESSSRSSQRNGVTLIDQKEHTSCRVLRSHAAAI